MMPYTDYTVRLGDLKRAIVKNPYNPNHNIDGYMRYLKYNTPSAQPERKTGKWIEKNNPNYSPFDTSGEVTRVCSECGYSYAVRAYFRYCPNCGARMEVEE